MKTSVLLPVMLFYFFILNAQSLAINDYIPDVELNHLLNYSSQTARLKDFNKQCLILDFWDTYCGDCIAAFPKLEKFQKEFADKIRFLLVNKQSQEKVKDFFKLKRQTQGVVTSLPSYNNDSILSRLFIHLFEPHFAWIDANGKVYAITGAAELDEMNLDAFIKGIPSAMVQKNDAEISYDYSKPLLIGGNGGNGSELIYHSVFSGFIDKLHATTTIFCDDKYGYRMTYLNQDIRSIYQHIYDSGEDDGGLGSFGINSNQTILEIPDSTVIAKEYPGRDGGKHRYCYELVTPPVKDAASLREFAKADLDRFFKIRAHIEKRKIPCWVIQSDDTAFVSSKGGVEEHLIEYFSVKMRNTKFLNLMRILRHFYMPSISYPIIDETGIKGRVDLEFNADMTSPESLNTALLPFKMHVIKEERWVDMLVLQPASN